MTDKPPQQNWQRLQLVDFGGPAEGTHAALTPARPNKHAGSRKEVEQSRAFSKGYEDGLSAGHAEGFAAGAAAGTAEGQQAAQQLLSLAGSLDKALGELDGEIADEILALSLEIARQILCQVIAVKPEAVLPVVHEALNQLPHQHATIYLNPEDAALVRKYSGDHFTHVGHRIHEDSQLQRGDVIIEANGAQVDATLTTRWRRIVESLGGKGAWISCGES